MLEEMPNFQELGEQVARAWQACGNDADRFPEIATAALRDSGILKTTTLDQIAEWTLYSNALPAQRLNGFGQPPVKVYEGRGFYIEVLLWIDRPTSIHQHGFAGAFGVLQGSSFHSEYRFECAERVCPHLLLGNLGFLAGELLERGDVRTIYPGERFIHSLLHLEPPSISLVVRTVSLPAYAPQYRYYHPGLAIDPFHHPEPLETQLALVQALQVADHRLFLDLAGNLVANADFWTAFKVVESASKDTGHWETFAVLMETLRQRHSDLVSVATDAFDGKRRRAAIKNAMKKTRNPEHRFFLAMLTSIPSRTAMQHLIAAHFPGFDPEQKMSAWTQELSDLGASGLLNVPPILAG